MFFSYMVSCRMMSYCRLPMVCRQYDNIGVSDNLLFFKKIFQYYPMCSILNACCCEGENSVKTVVLLTISNVFMTAAWYGHLKHKDVILWKVILISWLIAFVEYCFQVPANRIGHYQFSAAQLKIIQEVITLIVFAVFSILYLKEE